MKYVLLIGITAIAARAARGRWRRRRGTEPVKAPRPARSSISLALIVTMFAVVWPLTEAVSMAGADPPRLRVAFEWAAFGLAAPLAAAYAYRRAKAADVPSFVVTQSAITAYSFVGLAVGVAAAAVWLAKLAR